MAVYDAPPTLIYVIYQPIFTSAKRKLRPNSAWNKAAQSQKIRAHINLCAIPTTVNIELLTSYIFLQLYITLGCSFASYVISHTNDVSFLLLKGLWARSFGLCMRIVFFSFLIVVQLVLTEVLLWRCKIYDWNFNALRTAKNWIKKSGTRFRFCSIFMLGFVN